MELGWIGDLAINLLIMVLTLLFFGGLFYTALWYFKRYKRYFEYKCIIWAKDGFGQVYEDIDNAGVFVEARTNAKRLWLKKNKIGLPADTIPFVQSGKNKIIYLQKLGLKNFRFIKPKINDDNVKLSVGEEDLNWALNSFDSAKKHFSENKLMKYLPFISMAFAGIVIMIIFIYFFKKLDVLADMAVSFENAADAISQANSGVIME